ncbi:MAG: hypothetical protein ACKOXK_02175 [Chakrabartia sp.]
MKFILCSTLALALAAPAVAQTTNEAGSPHHGAKSTKPHSTKADKGSTSGAADGNMTTGDGAGALGADNAANPAVPASPADPSANMAATSATPATPGNPTAQSQTSDPVTILKTEFPVYDKDASGSLSKTEFSTWLLALKKAAPQQTPLTDAQQTEWLGTAFTEADSDKSSSISLAELTTYLTRGAKS